MDDDVIETLREAQRFGFFGSRPIDEAAEHSMSFVRALGEVAAGTRIVDIGSGGGLPGLVIASSFPSASVTLVDRRQKRTDFLRRAVHRLGWDHVAVIEADVGELVRAVTGGTLEPFDVVTARGFGPPAKTLRVALALAGPEGMVMISEPPAGDRWDEGLLIELQVTGRREGAVRVFHRTG